MADQEMDLSNVHQVVLVATDPHIDDLFVQDAGSSGDSEDLLPAKVFQVPVKVADDDKVETKMAALIVVEKEDLPLDAQEIIKGEIQEVKASGSETMPVAPQPVTTSNQVVLPPFEPYYYAGRLPNNFANSVTTNVSTNSLSMHKISVDSTKLVDMLTMARLSTQLSSINDSIHSFVVTSEASQSSKLRFRGDTSSGLYSSSPCRSSEIESAAKKSAATSESESQGEKQ